MTPVTLRPLPLPSGFKSQSQLGAWLQIFLDAFLWKEPRFCSQTFDFGRSKGGLDEGKRCLWERWAKKWVGRSGRWMDRKGFQAVQLGTPILMGRLAKSPILQFQGSRPEPHGGLSWGAVSSSEQGRRRAGPSSCSSEAPSLQRRLEGSLPGEGRSLQAGIWWGKEGREAHPQPRQLSGSLVGWGGASQLAGLSSGGAARRAGSRRGRQRRRERERKRRLR